MALAEKLLLVRTRERVDGSTEGEHGCSGSSELRRATEHRAEGRGKMGLTTPGLRTRFFLKTITRPGTVLDSE